MTRFIACALLSLAPLAAGLAASPPGAAPPGAATSASSSSGPAHRHGSTAKQAAQACSKQAREKHLTGAAREQFMTDCRAGKTTG